MKTLVVVASRTRARLLHFSGPGKDFELINTLDNPDGRLKNQDIDASAGGSASTSSAGRHGMEVQVEPTEVVAKKFAGDIAREIGQKRQLEKPARIVLAAEPGFLGLLRGSLDSETEKFVNGSVTKDLDAFEVKELKSHFKEVLPV